MKTQIIFESQKPSAVQNQSQDECFLQETDNTEFENEIKKALFLTLLEKGFITHAQYEQCLELL